MSLQRFTTESYREVDRANAWREALSRVGLAGTVLDARCVLHGTMHSQTSIGGFELITVASAAQTLELDSAASDSLLVLLLIDGSATLAADGVSTPLGISDLVYVPSRERASLVLDSDFRLFAFSQCVCRAPR